MVTSPKVRLFVEVPLVPDAVLDFEREAVHYLVNVMRMSTGDSLLVFNGADGEWRARVDRVGRRKCVATVHEMTRPQEKKSDLWIAVAPIKRTRMEILIEKVTELGVDLIQPVLTSRTVVTRLSMPRLQAHAREAAEQCGRLTVPDISEPVSLNQFLESVGQARRILWCDESGDSVPISKAVAGLDASDRDVPWSLLIGPEGGFDPSERTLIAGNKAVMGVDLGPRVLRSETAAIVALGLWHSLIGTV